MKKIQPLHNLTPIQLAAFKIGANFIYGFFTGMVGLSVAGYNHDTLTASLWTGFIQGGIKAAMEMKELCGEGGSTSKTLSAFTLF